MKVLIISGTQTVRAKLRELMELQPEVSTVKEADDTLTGLLAIDEDAPDVVVVDFQMSLRNCTDTIRRMLCSKPDLKIIGLSMYCDRRFLDECFRAGACGYILKDCAYEELAEAVRTVASDRHYVSSSVQAPMV